MATEQDKASLSLTRGKQAAKMSHDDAKDYIAGAGKIDKDYQGTAEETAGVSKKQQMQEVLGSMKKGGMVKATGLYKLHKGEKVVPHGGSGRINRTSKIARTSHIKGLI